jgi:L-ascorbate metabolism protein UlaG (beta-lactamase superfamily)
MSRVLKTLTLTLALTVLSAPAWAVEIQWFGQSAYKITTARDQVILIDPFITGNPLTPDEEKDLSKLGEVDLILVTHGHGDHIGDTGKIAEITGAKVALNADMGHTFRALGIVPGEQLIRFNKGGPIEPLDGVIITMTHAEHSSEIVHPNPETGAEQVYPGGEPAGFIIELADGPTLYNAGDTGVFGDMAFIAEYYQPDVAFLPIGGHFTMDPAHAAYAVKNLLKTGTVVPMHYGTFPPLQGTPEEFEAALGEDYTGNLVVMEPGQTRAF